MSNYVLRLQSSLLDEVRKIAEAEGTAVNQFIDVAVAEKAAALRTAQYFAERRGRANVKEFRRLLEKAVSEPPRAGDEVPRRRRRRASSR